jgi:hypothetical protein
VSSSNDTDDGRGAVNIRTARKLAIIGALATAWMPEITPVDVTTDTEKHQ